MKVAMALAVVLLLGAACADALTVREAVKQRMVGCPDPSDFNACLTHVVDSIRAKVVTDIVNAGSDEAPGVLPEQRLGPVTLSGTSITYSGVDTVKISHAQLLDNDILAATLNIGYINFDGDMLAKLPIIGAVKAHLKAKVNNLLAKLRLHLAVRGDQIVIKKFTIKVSTDQFAASINNGGPITRPNGTPLPKAINGMVQRLIKGINKKAVLEKRLVPLVLRLMRPFLLKRVNTYIAALPTV